MWDVPLTAVLVDGDKETPIYPVNVSINRELMLSEQPRSTENPRGTWSGAAHLISRNVALHLVEICDGCAIFRL